MRSRRSSAAALLAGLVFAPSVAAQADRRTEPTFERLFEPPLGLPSMPLPDDARPTEAEFRLGGRLFRDPILSVDDTVSCASCHRPEAGFASPEPLPAGVQGRRALRHAPSLFNRGYGRSQRWDGRTPTLDEQVLLPIHDPNEMGLPLDRALEKLRADAGYRRAFTDAFGTEADKEHLARVLATFVRGIVRGDSPVDRFQAGHIGSLTAPEKAGLWIFESKGACWKCHTPPLFTDEGFHNTGVGVVDGEPRPGRFAVTGNEVDRGRFKTPTLRGVSLTAPYMHDGSLRTLEEVIEFYRRGGNANPDLDERMKPIELTDREAENLLAFLRAL